MVEQGKVSGFRLPPDTLRKLDDLIDADIIKNRTDGVIKAIDRYYDENAPFSQLSAFLRTLNDIVKVPSIAQKWAEIPPNTNVWYIRDDNTEFYIYKKSEECAIIHAHPEDLWTTVALLIKTGEISINECEPGNDSHDKTE